MALQSRCTFLKPRMSRKASHLPLLQDLLVLHGQVLWTTTEFLRFPMSQQAAATRSLEAGTTLDSVLEMTSRVAPTLKSPIVLFTYINPILSRGYENFIKKIADSGVKGTHLSYTFERHHMYTTIDNRSVLTATALFGPSRVHLYSNNLIEENILKANGLHLLCVHITTSCLCTRMVRLYRLCIDLWTVVQGADFLGFGAVPSHDTAHDDQRALRIAWPNQRCPCRALPNNQHQLRVLHILCP